jgi:hypothetical protein
MQELNMDSSQFVELSVDHCPQEESSAAGGSSTQRQFLSEWNATFCDFRHSVQLNIAL